MYMPRFNADVQQQPQPRREKQAMKKPSTSRPNIYQTLPTAFSPASRLASFRGRSRGRPHTLPEAPSPATSVPGSPMRHQRIFALVQPYSSPFWLTFKQAQELKGTVRKGEKGTQIVFYKQLRDRNKEDESTREADDRAPFVLCYYAVFNVEQCDGLTLPQIIEQPTTAPEIDADETAKPSLRDGRAAPLFI